jgi:predicted amidophosphoribosyltransferase
LTVTTGEYKLSNKKTCPYCQSAIKQESDTIYCSDCGTPHHIECWEENRGCTTYGCSKNSVAEIKTETGTDIGKRTLEEIEKIFQEEKKTKPKETDCKYCGKKIDVNSKYCKHCGNKQSEDQIPSPFEEEYKKRYRDNIILKRNSNVLAISSIIAFSLVVLMALYVTYKEVNDNLTGEKYRIKQISNTWNDAYQKRDIEKIKPMLDKDYLYYDKNNKTIDASQRLKMLSGFFRTAKYKNCVLLNLKTEPDSTSSSYIFLSFDQVFSYDNETKTEKRSFKLYREEESKSKWKIFREYVITDQ